MERLRAEEEEKAQARATNVTALQAVGDVPRRRTAIAPSQTQQSPELIPGTSVPLPTHWDQQKYEAAVKQIHECQQITKAGQPLTPIQQAAVKKAFIEAQALNFFKSRHDLLVLHKCVVLCLMKQRTELELRHLKSQQAANASTGTNLTPAAISAAYSAAKQQVDTSAKATESATAQQVQDNITQLERKVRQIAYCVLFVLMIS